ncbi:45725_t:CDS:2 [Gigaspora margarita]|uniref:45725_t:CDS:1 n=1 Tax=Gigaspora margarita TaxID=4874 RepID=A0ABM8VXX0_GIGMA|nr:45725_t:CDS:2 [Gigaspora margarita]
MATSSNEAQPAKRQRLENDDKKSICWKYFEPFKVPKEHGTTTKCIIPGCTTKYIWHGSTTNHVGHLKTKHGIIKDSISLTSNDVSEPETNLVGHLKTKHCIINSSTPLISTGSFESEIYLQLIDFIVSSGAFNIVDNLPTSNILKEQINNAYNHSFHQLKSKAQQEKTTIISINKTITATRFDKSHVIITCCWLTENFEFHKILLLAKEWYSHINENEDLSGAIIKALEKWELTNVKFYIYDNIGYVEFFGRLYHRDKKKYRNLIPNVLKRLKNEEKDYFNDLGYLIHGSLEKWTSENVNTQGMFDTIKVIRNAVTGIYDVVNFLKNIIVQQEIEKMKTLFSDTTIKDIQNAEEIRTCSNPRCTYHKIAFLKLMEKPFIQLVSNYNSYNNTFIREQGKRYSELMLDSLPFSIFSIFSILLQVFKPLEHNTCGCNTDISTEKYMDLVDEIVINADNMLRNLPSSDDLEYKIIKSLLISIPSCNGLLIEQLALFLDQRSKQDEISGVIKNYAQKECQAHYLKNFFSDNLNESIRAANKELEFYITRPTLSLDGNINPYEWWKGRFNKKPG